MELKHILESLLFNTQRPLSVSEIREILAKTAQESEDAEARAFRKTKEADITTALEQMESEYADLGRTFRIVCVAGSWQFVTAPEFAPWLKTLVGARSRPPRLTQPALETLAVIAYRQPVTRAEIEQVRGVAVDGVISTLHERGLIEQRGRAEVVGRPITYGTTPLFLEYFGLRDLDQLPAADELRRIVVEKPASLLTVDPDLATAPPEALRDNGSGPGDHLATTPPAPDTNAPGTIPPDQSPP